MLVLGLNEGGRVRIETPGGDIWITLLPPSHGKRQRRLGIDAPRELKIIRETRITTAPHEAAPETDR